MKKLVMILAVALLCACKQGDDTAAIKAAAQKMATEMVAAQQAAERAAEKAAADKDAAAKAVALKEAEAQIDTSTPENALKSYWAMRDRLRQAQLDWRDTHHGDFDEMKGSAVFEPEKVMSGKVLAYTEIWKRKSIYNQYVREIQSVKQEKDGKTIIVALVRDATPIPEGLTEPVSDKKLRSDGRKFKYVLEKGDAGWRVTQVFEPSWFSPAQWVEYYHDLPPENLPMAYVLTEYN